MPEPDTSRKRVRVLVVDDDAENRRLLRELLEGWDIDVVAEAANGAECVELVDTLDPDVVLMDVRMPIMDGIEAGRIITDSSRTGVVLLTTHDDSFLRQRAQRAGVFAYVRKEDPVGVIRDAIFEAWHVGGR